MAPIVAERIDIPRASIHRAYGSRRYPDAPILPASSGGGYGQASRRLPTTNGRPFGDGLLPASKESGVTVARISRMEADRAQEVSIGLCDLAPVLDVGGGSPRLVLEITQSRERADRARMRIVIRGSADRRVGNGSLLWRRPGDFTCQHRANAEAHKQGRRPDGKSEPRLCGCESTHDVCSLFVRRSSDGLCTPFVVRGESGSPRQGQHLIGHSGVASTTPVRQSGHEMVKTVTNWVNEVQHKRRAETANALKILSKTPRPSEI